MACEQCALGVHYKVNIKRNECNVLFNSSVSVINILRVSIRSIFVDIEWFEERYLISQLYDLNRFEVQCNIIAGRYFLN